MKKIYFIEILFLGLALFISGCDSSTELSVVFEYTCRDGLVVNDLTECSPPESYVNGEDENISEISEPRISPLEIITRFHTSDNPEYIDFIQDDYFDNYGFMHIVGAIRNNGDKEVIDVKVMATLYGEDDNVLGMYFDYADNISTGKISRFNITIRDVSAVAKYRSAEVRRYSLNYTYLSV